MHELSNDELAKLSNNDLRRLFLELRSIINNFKKNKLNCTKEEVYYCYISEELNNRNNF